MSNIAIRVENLSKQYKIRATQNRHDTLRDQIMHSVKSVFGLNGHQSAVSGPQSTVIGPPSSVVSPQRSAPSAQRLAPSDFFWALKDVSFDVKQGEVVGVVGRNGAGKSTLLKILSRIMEPTTGRAEIHGRVGSLLEVGTGFHSELSGRENIYFSGATLGMRKSEIDRKYDEIVAFAEVEKFLDTPVKHYSSGMYTRLAFAVAAHIETEILLVDEVLAVGDAAFQKKCLGKMEDVARKGRTVLFVSHNTTAVLSLCTEAVLIESGRLRHQAPAHEIVHQYLQSINTNEIIPLEERQDRTGDGSVRLLSVLVESAGPEKVICSTSRLRVTIEYRSDKPIKHARFLVGIYDTMRSGIFALNSDAFGGIPDVLPAGGSVTCVTAPINLTPGRCFVNLAVLKGGATADYVQNATSFDVEADDGYGVGKLPSRGGVLCVLNYRWSIGRS